ncbi:hypothetical protein, partial [Acinetobacter baumannii]|uniref:hypothetical protein n=1 Tax=Acinetobacter baumannii TaxID=470 RepID=UPI001CDCE596
FIAILCFFSVWWYASSKGAVSCKGLSDLYIKGQEKKIVFLFSKVIIDYVQTGLYILVWDDNLKKCQTLS